MIWQVADEAGVRDRVFMVQGVSNVALPEYYQMADCLVNPSRWEGFGIVFIEALAAGTVRVLYFRPLGLGMDMLGIRIGTL